MTEPVWFQSQGGRAGPHIADALWVVDFGQEVLFLEGVGPNFVHLNVEVLEIEHGGVCALLATDSDANRQLRDGIAVSACHTFDRADRVTLDGTDGCNLLIKFQLVHGHRPLNLLGLLLG